MNMKRKTKYFRIYSLFIRLTCVACVFCMIICHFYLFLHTSAPHIAILKIFRTRNIHFCELRTPCARFFHSFFFFSPLIFHLESAIKDDWIPNKRKKQHSKHMRWYRWCQCSIEYLLFKIHIITYTKLNIMLRTKF